MQVAANEARKPRQVLDFKSSDLQKIKTMQ
jgi:hypothetical protein